MWEDGEEEALLVGLTLEQYWGEMTPKLYRKYLGAYSRRLEDTLLIMDTANHVLGSYIRTAVSDILGGKNNYPKEPVIKQARNKPKPFLKRVFSKAETEAYLKRNVT